MKIALFVEGQSDQETLATLARKVSPNLGVITRLLRRGDLLNADKVSAFVETDINAKHSDVLKVILCPDSECTPEHEFQRIVQPVENELRRRITAPPVHYCGVIHATEAWLACDTSALGQYLGSTDLKDSAARRVANSCKPKQELRELFGRHGRDFTNVQDNPRLADRVNVQELIRTSQSFARFSALILNT